MDNFWEQLLSELADRGYDLGWDREVAYFLSKVTNQDTGQVYPCDTCITVRDISGLLPEDRSQYVFFVTFICHGMKGKGAEIFNETVDRMSYNSDIGKFVRDYTDESNDVLYVTNECLADLTAEIVIGQLEYHAKVKLKVAPVLEQLRKHILEEQ